MTHPAEDLNDVIHQRTRLGIMVVLAEGNRVQFGLLKDHLSLTDGNLSRHLSILEEAGYVDVEKTFVDKRSRTWIKATRSGKRALSAEIASLKALVDRVEESAP